MIIRALLFFTALSVFWGCRREQDEFIPNVIVQEVIFLNASQYAALNNFPAAIEVKNAGWRGLIVFRYGPNDFWVYDKACAYRPLDDCHVLDLNSLTNAFDIGCSCCQSKFSLLNGGVPIQRPARQNLRQYRWDYAPLSMALSINNF